MKFVIGGVEVELTRTQIEERLAKMEPEPLKQVFVVVGARKFPADR